MTTEEESDPCYFRPITHDFRAMLAIWISAIVSCLIAGGILYWLLGVV
jgi:hypothetical protein